MYISIMVKIYAPRDLVIREGSKLSRAGVRTSAGCHSHGGTMKEWYDTNFFMNIMWTITTPALWIIELTTIGMDKRPKWIRWWHNRTDNLWDQIKEWVHCHKIPFTNKQINISFMMKNRETYGKFIRPMRDDAGKCWSNCDPDDCK
jgi:hypothetical protein